LVGCDTKGSVDSGWFQRIKVAGGSA
jgi:hypothetical protein